MAEKKSMGFIMGYFNHPFKWSLYSNPYLQPVTSGSFTPWIKHHITFQSSFNLRESHRIQSARWRSCATKVGTSKLPAPCWRQSQPCWPALTALTLKKTPTRRVFKAFLKKAPRCGGKYLMCGGWMVVPVLGILFVFSVLMYQNVYDESWIRATSKISKQLETKTLGSA